MSMAAEGEVGVRLMPYVLTPVLGIMAEQNFKFRAVRLQRRTTVNALSQSFVQITYCREGRLSPVLNAQNDY